MTALTFQPNLKPILDEDEPNPANVVQAASDLLEFVNTSPLKSVVSLGPTSVHGGGRVDSIEFVMTSRVRMGGDVLVGGPNGELFNATENVRRAEKIATR